MVARISYENKIIIFKMLMKFLFGILITTLYYVLSHTIFLINMDLCSLLKFWFFVEKLPTDAIKAKPL